MAPRQPKPPCRHMGGGDEAEEKLDRPTEIIQHPVKARNGPAGTVVPFPIPPRPGQGDKIVPAEVETERALLCGLLSNADLQPPEAGEVFQTLTPRDFYDPDHRRVYQGLHDVHTRTGAYDLAAVGAELERAGLMTAPDLAALAAGWLANADYTPLSMLPYHAATVKRAAVQRRVIEAAGKINALGYDESLPDPGALLDAVRGEVETLTRTTAPAPVGDAWQVLDFEDLLELAGHPVEYVVDGIVQRGGVCVVYGGPGSLKSMLCADLAVSVAAGERWLVGLPSMAGTPIVPGHVTHACPVGWLDLDQGARRTAGRLVAAAYARGLSRVNVKVWSMPTPWPDLSQPGNVATLTDRILRYGLGLLVVDTLSQVRGDVVENDAQMSAVMGALRRVAEATGCAIVLIHHVNKGAGASQDRMRGSSAIAASVDVALQVDRDAMASTLTITPTKCRDAAIPPFSVEWTHEQDADGQLAAARFYGLGLSGSTDVNAAIFEALQDGPLSTAAVFKAVQSDYKHGVNKIRAALKDLAAAGKLTAQDNGAGKEVLYSLP